MKCPECGARIKEVECPECGYRLTLKDVGVLKRVNYLIERKKGDFIYSHFQSIQRVSVELLKPPKDIKPIRKELGDFIYSPFDELVVFSLCRIYPLLEREIFEIGKLLNYLGVRNALKTMEGMVLRVLAKIGMTWKGMTWKILENKKVREMQGMAWKNAGGGILTLKKADRKENKLIYQLEESGGIFFGKKLKVDACSVIV